MVSLIPGNPQIECFSPNPEAASRPNGLVEDVARLSVLLCRADIGVRAWDFRMSQG